MSDLDNETRAIAIIGMSFGIALLSLLKSKGMVSSTETDQLLDGMLINLEGFQEPNDRAIQKARVIFDGIAQIIRRA
jgi:hypothetical protein